MLTRLLTQYPGRVTGSDAWLDTRADLIVRQRVLGSFLTGFGLFLLFAACVVLAVVWGQALGTGLVVLAVAALLAAVVLGVHHAEVIALRVGEPFGTLVLALAITVIELGLIGSVMVSGAAGASALARDTLFATVMIVCNGVVGI